MRSDEKTVLEAEHRFWQSMVDEDTDTALSLLSEPALMVSAHGAMKFDHAGYRRMAEQGTMQLRSFEISDMQAVFPADHTAVLTYRVRQFMAPRGKDVEAAPRQMADSSTWVRRGDRWLCVMHTETPIDPAAT